MQVFCPLPICWGLDTGWNHTFGECWVRKLGNSMCTCPIGHRPIAHEGVLPRSHPRLLSSQLKYQIDPSNPLYGQRGAYTPEYRAKYKHLRGGAPSHVPWTGGVMGATVDLNVKWTTGLEGMRSSKGHELTNWRAWEGPGTYEKRLAKRRRRPIS